jgi:ribonuclease P protein component
LTVALCCPAAVRVAVGSSPSVTNRLFELSINPEFPHKPLSGDSSFPKSSRILKPSDYRKVYDNGKRMTCPYFAAFCLSSPDLATGPCFGFTTPRALGKAVIRNRIRRRIREAVRLEKSVFGAQWMVVFNPRRAALDAPFDLIRREVAKVASRCA